MTRAITILLLSFATCLADDVQRTNEVLHLKATVQEVVPFTLYSGAVIPVHVDPMFALKVRVESVTPADTDFAPGTVVTFGIHSPSKLFGAESVKGKTYYFSLRRATESGKVSYSDLELRKEQPDKPLQPAQGGALPLVESARF